MTIRFFLCPLLIHLTLDLQTPPKTPKKRRVCPKTGQVWCVKCNFYQQTGRLFVLLRDVGIRLQFGFRLQFWEALERLCSLIVKRSTVILSVYALGWALKLAVWALRFVDMSLGTSSRNAAVRRQVVAYVNKECHSTSTRSHSTSTIPLGLGVVGELPNGWYTNNSTDEQCNVGSQCANAQVLRSDMSFSSAIG